MSASPQKSSFCVFLGNLLSGTRNEFRFRYPRREESTAGKAALESHFVSCFEMQTTAAEDRTGRQTFHPSYTKTRVQLFMARERTRSVSTEFLRGTLAGLLCVLLSADLLGNFCRGSIMVFPFPASTSKLSNCWFQPDQVARF